jgi:hypothetical protein
MTVPQIRAALVAIGEQPRTARELADVAHADPDRLRKCLHWLRRRGGLRYAGQVWRLATRDVDAVVADWRARCA